VWKYAADALGAAGHAELASAAACRDVEALAPGVGLPLVGGRGGAVGVA
jgi:hypothetical protein